jgi:hypothetical protein
MRENLNIPSRIRVGFQKRNDTYTGKLGFVISADRKDNPKSWEGWRDKNIEPQEFDNVPTEGFVLNRDVGGTQRSYSWNARREKVRVYDPRGFEFEITVENVLLILQECSSIKGKGLEGQFVISWSGNTIILLPICSNEYKVATELIDLSKQKVAAAKVKPGCTFRTKDRQNVMYMGRHEWDLSPLTFYQSTDFPPREMRHIFLLLDRADQTREYLAEKGFTKLASQTSDTPSPQYAEEYERMMKSRFVSTVSKIVLEPLQETDLKQMHHYQQIALLDGDSVYMANLINYQPKDSPVRDLSYELQYSHQKLVLVENKGVAMLYVNNDKPKSLAVYYNKELSAAEVLMIAKKPFFEYQNGALVEFCR